MLKVSNLKSSVEYKSLTLISIYQSETVLYSINLKMIISVLQHVA